MSKVEEAIGIIRDLGFGRGQQNERSALVLLALVQLREDGAWSELANPLMGVWQVLDFCRQVYSKNYAENTRESIRKETLHQFVDQGLVLQNPDDPSRPPNSPHWCYQISREGLKLLKSFGSSRWERNLATYLLKYPSLMERNQMARGMSKTPLVLPSGALVHLSTGSHSELIRDIVEEFGERFVTNGQVLYIGDTGNKSIVFEKEALLLLGVDLEERGKLPDVILYSKDKNWLFLIESVTSVGPVDGKRHRELASLFSSSSAGLVFVTVFPDKVLFARFVADISWETEVWIRDHPDHLIHFNGDRFLGPHARPDPS